MPQLSWLALSAVTGQNFIRSREVRVDDTVSAGGSEVIAVGASPVPLMPVIRPHEQRLGAPVPLIDGLPLIIGWQWRTTARGGPCFATLRRSAMGSYKVLERFPLTWEGWARAWDALVDLDRGSAEKARARLKERGQGDTGPAKVAELDARTLVRLAGVTLLGGYAPDAPIAVGEQYDARFLDDRLAICVCRNWKVLAQVPYGAIEDVEIGGPGLVRSGGGFVGGGFGAVGALEGMAIAAVLNALTARTAITTIIRVQAGNCELFLLWTKTTPDQLRIELSKPLGAIRAARAAADQAPASPASPGRADALSC